jgi:dihydroflavonol-4-reductase
MQTAGIIGGSGFIGSHIVQKFLKEDFRVKVSTTDINNKSKYEHLYQLDNVEDLEIVPLDVRNKEALAHFLKDCNVVVHCGTPFQLDVKDPQSELFDPTIKGTENFLETIKNTPGLEKVIIVASVAAWNTSFPLPPASYSPEHIFSENDQPYFSETDHPYAQSKFIADQAVRKFIRDNPDPGFEIITVCPVMVIGKSLSARQDSTSIGLQYLIKNKIAPNPFVEMLFSENVSFSMVDVRDVAEAILQAAIKPGLHGKNYLVANETYKVSDISLMLNQQPPVAPPARSYSNDLIKKDLGLQFTPASETLYHCE